MRYIDANEARDGFCYVLDPFDRDSSSLSGARSGSRSIGRRYHSNPLCKDEIINVGLWEDESSMCCDTESKENGLSHS